MVLSMDKWRNKIAVVTGANSGIGAATVDALLGYEVKVIGLDMNINTLEEKKKSQHDKLFFRKINLRNEEDILATFQWIEQTFSSVDILINCAGVLPETTLSEGDTELWKTVLDVNILAVCITTREAIKLMKKNNVNGHIININSVTGHYVVYFPNCNLYPASKYAVTALTETLRKELIEAGSKIKISSVSPGSVATGLAILKKDMSDERRKFMENLVVLKPEDIADGIVYLLSTPVHVQVQELTIRPVGETY